MIDDEERRARLAYRHHLLPRTRTDDLLRLADDLVAFHSTDPATVYLSATARMATPSLEAVESALYEDRSLIRHHAMRRTLWVATAGRARQIHAAATRDLVAPERRRTGGLLAAAGIAEPEAWLEIAEAAVLADLRAHGPSTAREVGERVEVARHPLQLAPGKSYGATQSAHTRVLTLLGFTGALVRTRPVGGWTTATYRYAATEDWLPGGLDGLDPDAAARDLAEQWVRAFGPATTADLAWWTGWPLRRTRAALQACGARQVALQDGPGWLAADDPGPPATEPWVAVLPSLDPTTMGWKARDWYLPDTAAAAFDRNGNAGPTLWVDGRVVGAWAQAPDGELRTHFFERVAAPRRAELAERLRTVADIIGETRFSVRFPGLIQRAILA